MAKENPQEALSTVQDAVLALLLWHYRLRPRSLSAAGEAPAGDLRAQIGFAAMVSFGPVSFPADTSMEVAERYWASNLYRAEAAAMLCLAPGAAERRLAELAGHAGSHGNRISSTDRATLAKAAEALGVQDRNAWVAELSSQLDGMLRDPQFWNPVEVLVTTVTARGVLTEQEVEDLLQRAGAPRAPWPDWMPGEAPAPGFYF